MVKQFSEKGNLITKLKYLVTFIGILDHSIWYLQTLIQQR